MIRSIWSRSRWTFWRLMKCRFCLEGEVSHSEWDFDKSRLGLKVGKEEENKEYFDIKKNSNSEKPRPFYIRKISKKNIPISGPLDIQGIKIRKIVTLYLISDWFILIQVMKSKVVTLIKYVSISSIDWSWMDYWYYINLHRPTCPLSCPASLAHSWNYFPSLSFWRNLWRKFRIIWYIII